MRLFVDLFRRRSKTKAPEVQSYELWALRPDLIIESGSARLAWTLFYWVEKDRYANREKYGPFNSEEDAREAYELLQVKPIVLSETRTPTDSKTEIA